MGGRGSSLVAKHIANNDNKIDIVITLGDPESEIHNEMFKKLKEINISTRKSTDVIDDIIFKRQQQQVYTIANKYNKILSPTTRAHDIEFGAEDMKGATLGYCSSSIENGQVKQRIALDTKQFANYDKVVDTVKKGIKKGWFAPINTMFKSRDYIVTHEFGHAVENGLITKIREKKGVETNDYVGFVRETQAEIKNEVIKIWKKQFTTGKEDDNIYLSEYSHQTDGEWFAETFTNLELSDNPAPIALALKEYLRRNK